MLLLALWGSYRFGGRGEEPCGAWGVPGLGLGCPPGAVTLPWRLLSWARACWMPAGLLWITWSRRKTAELLGGGGGRGSPWGRSSGGRLKKAEHQLQGSLNCYSLFPVKIHVFDSF